MLEIYERLGVLHEHDISDSLILTHAQRERGRFRAATLGGREARIFLERGTPLLVGEVLRSRCGTLLQIRGAEEPVTVAECDDWHLFARACYHLGNRHVKVEIGYRELSFAPDHVLETMLVGLGLDIRRERRIFCPESGAYVGGIPHEHHHH
jgi:urease accessory protein